MSSNKSSWYMKGGKPYSNQGRKPIWFRKNAKAPSTSGSTSSNKSKLLKYVVETKPTAYTGWRLYFLEEAYTEGSTTHRKIKHCEEFIQRHLRLFSFEKIEENQAFTLDLTVIKKDDSFNSVWPNFFDELTTSAEHILSCLGLAMHQTIIQAREKLESTDQEIQPCELRKIHARITNHEPILHLKNLKVNYYGKLVSVRGTVIRVSDVKLICRWMTFECGSCRGKQVLKQPDGVYTVPTRCDTRGCKAQTRFRPVLSLPHTRTDNWQMLKLQELIGTDQCEGGRIPRIVECELTDDLVNSCVPGDDVTITGIIKVRNTGESSGTKTKQASIFLLYMDAVSVVNNKNQSQASHGASGIEFNLVDYYAIQKIHAEPALFKLLVHSLCPAIYGHEMIKAGLILSLFGGTASGPGTRADPHILMVGDPGLGKSQMLQACSNVAPRGVFVCGNTSTSSGLTVTMTRESGGEYSLEAGALILADQGCCCIDEFDKMPTQHAALLEAMEQQTVSIAKAGVVSILPARTTILAAANPVGGHYTKAKTVSENLRIDSALLSRFDLVFILRDKPNQLLDSLLSEHVLSLHDGMKQKKISVQSSCSDVSIASDEYVPLQENLKLFKDEEVDVLPHQLLRKYIAYARKYVHPSLSPEAANVLKKFYLELRKRHLTSDGTPVTTRQSQSLTRLTLARAKVELREIATEKDALDVVEIVKYSLVDTFSDEYDKLDFKRLQNGSGMSQRNKVKVFVSVLQRIAEVESRSEFTITELRQAAQNGGVGDDFYNLLNTLNLHGYLLKKDSNIYKLLSVD